MAIPDRESSPDWLRSFQTPQKEFATLSSSSPSSSSLQRKCKRNLEDDNSNEEVVSAKSLLQRVRPRTIDLDSETDNSGADERARSIKHTSKGTQRHSLENRESHHKATAKAEESMEMLDSQRSLVEDLPITEEVNNVVKGFQLPVGVLPKVNEAVAAADDDIAEVQEKRSKRVFSSLPLMLGDKVHRSKILLECEGDALDLSGDVGAVGRVSVSGNSNEDFRLDLKGIIYKATIVPSNTFFVVNIGQAEAKVEAIMNDFVQLQPSSNVFESETMVEGTLDDFVFESEDDKEYIPAGADAVKSGADLKDETKQPKQKTKPNQLLKTPKSSMKKVGKSKAKASGKTGSARKSTKKSNPQKRSGK